MPEKQAHQSVKGFEGSHEACQCIKNTRQPLALPSALQLFLALTKILYFLILLIYALYV
jgi:hypothetical protein